MSNIFSGMFSGPPPALNPSQVAQQQYDYNYRAGKDSQKLNMIGQSNPYGSMTWVKDPNAPGGYRMDTGLSGSALTDYNTGNRLAENTAGMYSQAPNFDASTMTNTAMDMTRKYMQPQFDIQNSNMAAQLQSQGFAPGTEAFTNAMRGLTQGQQGVMAQTYLQAEPIAFNQAVQAYEEPLKTQGALRGLASTSFGQTPQTQVQPPNYAGLAQNTYDQQMKQYQNNQSGMWGLASAIGGGAGKAMGGGMGGGGWGQMGSMFMPPGALSGGM